MAQADDGGRLGKLNSLTRDNIAQDGSMRSTWTPVAPTPDPCSVVSRMSWLHEPFTLMHYLRFSLEPKRLMPHLGSDFIRALSRSVSQFCGKDGLKAPKMTSLNVIYSKENVSIWVRNETKLLL